MRRDIQIALRSWLREHLPRRLLRLQRSVRHGYRYKRRRTGPLDYVAEFDHRDLRKAKGSIVWNDRWDEVSAATLQILRNLDLVEGGQTVLDFGCGIGRISRALIEKYQIRVIAVDRSLWMRRHFRDYFLEKDFSHRALSSGEVQLWSDEEFVQNVPVIEEKVNLVLFIEVLQHIPEPILDQLLPQVTRTLSPGGKLFVFGNSVLDVDSSGSRATTPIAAFLRKQSPLLTILREDVWQQVQAGELNYTFSQPRYSFLACRPELLHHI